VFFGSIGIILIQNAAAAELRNYCGKPRGGFGSGYTENQIKGKLMEMSETKRPDPREIDYSQPPSISLR
jgi:hypothetical protein